MKQIMIDVCENNNYGNKSGKATRISVGGLVEFECDNCQGYGFTHSQHRGFKRFRVNRKLYVYNYCTEWTGNMMWNSYNVDFLTATSLLSDLWKSDNWDWAEIDGELKEILETDGCLFGADLLRLWEQDQSSRSR